MSALTQPMDGLSLYGDPGCNRDREKGQPSQVPALCRQCSNHGTHQVRCSNHGDDSRSLIRCIADGKYAQDCRKPQPSDACEMPRKSESLLGESIAPKQMRQIGAPKQSNKDVAFAQERVSHRQRNGYCSSDQKRDIHGPPIRHLLCRTAAI